MPTRFLFVFGRPPHASLHVQELLDMTLTAAAFDQPVSLLLIDDGVYSLKTHQQPRQLECKDLVPVFDSLGLYDVEHVYVEAQSLDERGLAADDMALPCELLSRSEVASLMARQCVIVNV